MRGGSDGGEGGGMSDPSRRHRLDGLEPDNLLAFLALLGLLRALDACRPDWFSLAAWALNRPPLRPFLTVPEAVTRERICEAGAQGIASLVAGIEFGSAADLKLEASEARSYLAGLVPNRRKRTLQRFAL